MSHFYTNVAVEGNNVLYRGFEDGQRVQRALPYSPTLYLPAPTGTWQTLKGEPLVAKHFKTIWDARKFVKQYQDVSNFPIYGNQRWEYAFLSDRFVQPVDYDLTAIRTAFLDIEVCSSAGFPKPELADQQVTAIAIRVGDHRLVLGLGPYRPTSPDIEYRRFDTEEDLLREFLVAWRALDIDIVTGWNIHTFDIPYLVNRITKLLGWEEACGLSPWDKMKAREMKVGTHREFTQQIYEIDGISQLDYLELYRKPTFGCQPQDSYTLDNIAEFELGHKKVNWRAEGYINLEDLRTRNHQRYIEYNVGDVDLVWELDDKLHLLELIITIAYHARTNYEDVFRQTCLWDSIVHHKLKERHIALPPEVKHHKTSQYTGAYVKEPKPGRYHHLVSFDLKSLYPHLIMMYNMSPETLVDPSPVTEPVTIQSLLDRMHDLSWLKDKHLTLTPNGQCFRTDKMGVFPELMAEMFAERDRNKGLMLEAKRRKEAATTAEDKTQAVKDYAKYKALQFAMKVTLNSAYGALGSPWFRLFDVRIAEAITTGGQLSIRWIQKEINQWLSKVLKVDGDFVVASDTDSVYVSLHKLVKSILGDQMDRVHVADLMNRIADEKMAPFIKRKYQELADYVNAYANKMDMRRESIIEQAVWTGKKHYIVSLLIDEANVRYLDKPEVKITGLDAIKSSTSKWVKSRMLGAIDIILDGNERQLIDFVEQCRQDFKSLGVKDIAWPRGINALGDYVLGDKAIPIHVRAALAYNEFLTKHELTQHHQLIREGDKIRFVLLRVPNPFESHVMAFDDEPLPEMELACWVDTEGQFLRSFRNQVEAIARAVHWTLDREDTLDSMWE